MYIGALSGGHFAKNYHVLVSLKLKQAENSIKQNLKQADQYIEEAERYFELYKMCENRDIMYALAFKLLILNLKNKDGNLDEQRRICSLIKFCKERGSISLSENMQRKIDEISQKIEEKLV